MPGIASSLPQIIADVVFYCAENEYKKGVKAGRVDSQGLAQLALSHCTRAKQANRMLKDAAVRGEQGDPLTIFDDWHRMRTVAE